MTPAAVVTAIVVSSLAGYRLTRAVTQDRITEAPREALAAKLGDFYGYLVTCAQCAGFWLTAGTAALWLADPPYVRVVIVVLAATGLQSVLASIIPED